MILTSMYTANLTAHLTLDRASTSIYGLEDLLKQSSYEWGLIVDRNLQIMMANHEDEVYNQVVARGKKLQSLDEGIERVNNGKFVFVDESSVLTYNFRKNCQTTMVKTGKFNNQWAFGTQVNSPYTALINSMFLQYREMGWFTTKFEEWYNNPDEEGAAQCTSSVGSDTKFGLPVLVGLFLILGVGALLSFVTVFLEILYVAHLDSIEKNKTFGHCLCKRLRYKFREVTEEWFGGINGRVEDYKANGLDSNHASDRDVVANSVLPNVAV